MIELTLHKSDAMKVKNTEATDKVLAIISTYVKKKK